MWPWYFYATEKSYDFSPLVMFLQGCLCRSTHGCIMTHWCFLLWTVFWSMKHLWPIGPCTGENNNDLSSVITTTTWQIQILLGAMSGQDEPVVLGGKAEQTKFAKIYFNGKHVWNGCSIMQSVQLSIHNKNLSSCKFEHGIQTSQIHLMVQVVGSPQCHIALTALWMQRKATLWPSTTRQGK